MSQISSMNKSVSNSSLSIFDSEENFFEKTDENIEQQELFASKLPLQLNTSMEIYEMLWHIISRVNVHYHVYSQ